MGLPLMNDAAEEADPNAIHPDVKREAPELGSRKPVPAPPE